MKKLYLKDIPEHGAINLLKNVKKVEHFSRVLEKSGSECVVLGQNEVTYSFEEVQVKLVDSCLPKFKARNGAPVPPSLIAECVDQLCVQVDFREVKNKDVEHSFDLAYDEDGFFVQVEDYSYVD